MAILSEMPTEACTLARGRKSSNGYITKVVSAHRLAWLQHRGPIPPGMFVLHKCDVKACDNIDHLFLGTAKDNAQDCIRKGRWNPRRLKHYNRDKTHCKHGHAFDEQNTYVRLNGSRLCKLCTVQYTRLWRAA